MAKILTVQHHPMCAISIYDKGHGHSHPCTCGAENQAQHDREAFIAEIDACIKAKQDQIDCIGATSYLEGKVAGLKEFKQAFIEALKEEAKG